MIKLKYKWLADNRFDEIDQVYYEFGWQKWLHISYDGGKTWEQVDIDEYPGLKAGNNG